MTDVIVLVILNLDVMQNMTFMEEYCAKNVIVGGMEKNRVMLVLIDGGENHAKFVHVLGMEKIDVTLNMTNVETKFIEIVCKEL